MQEYPGTMVDWQAVQESFVIVEALPVWTQEVELGWVERTRRGLMESQMHSRYRTRRIHAELSQSLFNIKLTTIIIAW